MYPFWREEREEDWEWISLGGKKGGLGMESSPHFATSFAFLSANSLYASIASLPIRRWRGGSSVFAMVRIPSASFFVDDMPRMLAAHGWQYGPDHVEGTKYICLELFFSLCVRGLFCCAEQAVACVYIFIS